MDKYIQTRGKEAAARRKKIAAWRAKGESYQRIADRLGITRQRVHQIAKETSE